MCDNVIFITSCINEAMGDKILWSTLEDWATLGTHIPKFQGCVRLLMRLSSRSTNLITMMSTSHGSIWIVHLLG
jgi:hypothetical protein